ncbi:Asp23/Gls24 family envelope stress response protein [Aerococcaceae bacterium DSM 111020]|nr:Asp23/Gls24 family envelope stress response protein [Aerococcaceae bacterium DSM 111020]
MSINISTPNGDIKLSKESIATVIGAAVTDNYGVVGMVSRNLIRDNMIELLGKENYARGIVLTQENNEIAVDVHILVTYGTKISVICQNIQETVKYNVENLLGFELNYVNVHVQGVKINE